MKIFKQKSQEKMEGEELTFKIEKMNCVSCAMNIDAELEEVDGVFSSKTQFASSKAMIKHDPEKVNQEKIIQTIERLGYEAKPVA